MTTNYVRQRIIAKGVSIISTDSKGKIRVRANYDPDLRPGDIFILSDGTEFSVGRITYNVSDSSTVFTVTEF